MGSRGGCCVGVSYWLSVQRSAQPPSALPGLADQTNPKVVFFPQTFPDVMVSGCSRASPDKLWLCTGTENTWLYSRQVSALLPPPRKQAAVRPELFIQICSRGRRLWAHWPRRRLCWDIKLTISPINVDMREFSTAEVAIWRKRPLFKSSHRKCLCPLRRIAAFRTVWRIKWQKSRIRTRRWVHDALPVIWSGEFLPSALASLRPWELQDVLSAANKRKLVDLTGKTKCCNFLAPALYNVRHQSACDCGATSFNSVLTLWGGSSQ